MVFAEKKIEMYEYTLQEIFGEVTLLSKEQLNKEKLDDVVSFLLNNNVTIGEIEGIRYEFKRKQEWLEDEEGDSK